MRLIENDRMSDAILGATSEHVLIKVVEYEGCEGTLQVFILGAVNLYQRKQLHVQQRGSASHRVKQSIVVQLVQSGQQTSVRLVLGAQQIEKSTKGRQFSSLPSAPTLV